MGIQLEDLPKKAEPLMNLFEETTKKKVSPLEWVSNLKEFHAAILECMDTKKNVATQDMLIIVQHIEGVETKINEAVKEYEHSRKILLKSATHFYKRNEIEPNDRALQQALDQIKIQAKGGIDRFKLSWKQIFQHSKIIWKEIIARVSSNNRKQIAAIFSSLLFCIATCGLIAVAAIVPEIGVVAALGALVGSLAANISAKFAALWTALKEKYRSVALKAKLHFSSKLNQDVSQDFDLRQVFKELEIQYQLNTSVFDSKIGVFLEYQGYFGEGELDVILPVPPQQVIPSTTHPLPMSKPKINTTKRKEDHPEENKNVIPLFFQITFLLGIILVVTSAMTVLQMELPYSFVYPLVFGLAFVLAYFSK